MKDGRNKEREEELSNYVFGKTQPQAVEHEEAVLGALMLQKGVFEEIEGIITGPEDFYLDKHGVIWDAVVKLHNKKWAIDLLTVTEQLKLDGKLDAAGGGYGIVELTNRVGSSANIVWHATTVKSKAIKRAAIKFGLSMVRMGYEETEDADTLIAEAEKGVTELSGDIVVSNDQDMAQMVSDEMKRIDAAKNKPDGITGVPTGFRDMDAVTGGWQDTDLIVLAARPGVGKTSLAIGFVEGAASKGNPIGVFSLEMSRSQLVSRLLSIDSEIATNKIRRGVMHDFEWQQLHGAMERTSGLNIRIDDTPGISITQLKAKARRWKRQHDIRMLVIDYLQLINGNGTHKGNREQEISFISRELKALAKELNIPVIALSQLSRSVETRGGTKRPQLSDLRESGAIEQDADIVMFIYRPEYYEIMEDEAGQSLKGVAEIIFAKHRNGGLGTEKLKFEAETTKFSDIDVFNPDPPANVPHSDTKIESGIRNTVTPSIMNDDEEYAF